MSELSREQQDQLVGLLEACAAFGDPQRWPRLVERMPADIRTRVSHSSDLHTFLTGLVGTCASYKGGLAALCQEVRWFEGNTYAMQAIEDFVTRAHSDGAAMPKTDEAPHAESGLTRTVRSSSLEDAPQIRALEQSMAGQRATPKTRQHASHPAYETPHSPGYIPRVDAMTQLNKLFVESSVLALEGLSGAGKTYLLTEFSRTILSAHGRQVLWYEAVEDDSIDSLITFLDSALALEGTTTKEKVHALCHLLAGNEWILMIDNFHQAEWGSFEALLRTIAHLPGPARLVLASQIFVEASNPTLNIRHYALKGFTLAETQHYLRDRGLVEIDQDLVAMLHAKTGGLPFAQGIFCTLVVNFARDPATLLGGDMARAIRLQKWFGGVMSAIGPPAASLLRMLSLLDGPFNRALLLVASNLVNLPDPWEPFEQLQRIFFVVTRSRAYWSVHDLVAFLVQDTLTDKSARRAWRAYAKELEKGIPRNTKALLIRRFFRYLVRAGHYYVRARDIRSADRILRLLAPTAKLRGLYDDYAQLCLARQNRCYEAGYSMRGRAG